MTGMERTGSEYPFFLIAYSPGTHSSNFYAASWSNVSGNFSQGITSLLYDLPWLSGIRWDILVGYVDRLLHEQLAVFWLFHESPCPV